MPRMRLDQALATGGLCQSRSQAESYIRLGLVKVDGKTITKAARMVDETNDIMLATDQYVSRAGLKLASVANNFKINFLEKFTLTFKSSTGRTGDASHQGQLSAGPTVDCR